MWHLPYHRRSAREIPDQPWAKIAAYLCNFRGSTLNVVVEYFSNFLQVKRLQKTISKSVTHALSEMFNLFCILDCVLTDNGPQFASTEFTRFCTSLGTQHTTSSPWHPQSNGKAENAVRAI